VPAKIAFDLQNDAGKFFFLIARPVSEQLVHRPENQAPSFAGADSTYRECAGIEAPLWNA
jgi:hypothetical protein